METEDKVYGPINTDELVRAKDHEEAFPYTDTNDCESTNESYAGKLGRVHPVVYVTLNMNGTEVKAVIDGWKFVMFARAAGIKEIYGCKLNVTGNDELREIMIQLARTNHQTYLALYYLILALWDKHWRGQGYRSDIKDIDLDAPIEGHDGKRTTIYERIGRDLAIKPHKVKFIKRIGDTNKVHFTQLDTERLSLYKVYSECNRAERGELPPVPKPKPQVIHNSNSSTPAPEFSEPASTGPVNFSPSSSTGGEETDITYTQPTTHEHDEHVDEEGYNTATEIPIGTVVSIDDEFITIRSTCQWCGKETFCKIYKSDINE